MRAQPVARARDGAHHDETHHAERLERVPRHERRRAVVAERPGVLGDCRREALHEEGFAAQHADLLHPPERLVGPDQHLRLMVPGRGSDGGDPTKERALYEEGERPHHDAGGGHGQRLERHEQAAEHGDGEELRGDDEERRHRRREDEARLGDDVPDDLCRVHREVELPRPREIAREEAALDLDHLPIDEAHLERRRAGEVEILEREDDHKDRACRDDRAVPVRVGCDEGRDRREESDVLALDELDEGHRRSEAHGLEEGAAGDHQSDERDVPPVGRRTTKDAEIGLRVTEHQREAGVSSSRPSTRRGKSGR